MTEPFVMSRLFHAPRERVWRAWTDPTQFVQWFGPKGNKCKVLTFDVRVGGSVHSRLTLPDGLVIYGKFVFREVKPLRRLVWEHFFADEAGNAVRHAMHAGWPMKLLTTVDFAEEETGTRLTLRWEPLDATADEQQVFADGMGSMNQGWGGTFEQLENFLAA